MFAQGRSESRRDLTEKSTITASGYGKNASPELAFDNNYATRWTGESANSWLQIDLGKPTRVERHLIRPEYAWKKYAFRLEYSPDGTEWQVLEDYTGEPVSGSPIEMDKPVSARFFRIAFREGDGIAEPSVIEWHLR